MTIGVLNLQGDVREHVAALGDVGVPAGWSSGRPTSTGCPGLVLPGGESTTLSMLLESTGLFDAVVAGSARRTPGCRVLGTCAGLVLSAPAEVLDGRPDQRTFGVSTPWSAATGTGARCASFETDVVFGSGEGPSLARRVHPGAPRRVAWGTRSRCWRPSTACRSWCARGRCWRRRSTRSSRRPPGAPALRRHVRGRRALRVAASRAPLHPDRHLPRPGRHRGRRDRAHRGPGGSVIEAAQHGDLAPAGSSSASRSWPSASGRVRAGGAGGGLRAGRRPSSTCEWNLSDTDVPKRVVLFTSKEDHCIADLLHRWRAGELECDMPCVISNHEDLRALVEWHGIPFLCVPVGRTGRQGGGLRGDGADLEGRQADAIVLARYMQILPAVVLRRTRVASSTSTTPSCRPSPAPGPTTRPSTGASSSSAPPATT